MPRPNPPVPGSRPALLPRSLVGSAAAHAVLIGAGVLLGVLAPGGAERAPRAFTATLTARAAPEPEPREVLEPLLEPALAEPELAESVVWAEPAFPLPAAEPVVAPPLRAVDWLAEHPLAIGTLVPPTPVAEAAGEGAEAAPVPVAELPPAVEPAPASVHEPVPRHTPAPGYPRLARRAGEEGSVLCRLHLDAAGAVRAVEVVESSGHARLDEAVRETLATWSFEPRREDGRAVPGSLLHRVTFRLTSG
ncbi:MAG TPA: TonB family protein [Planctomycetota bacterium]